MRQELADRTSAFIGRRHSLTLRQTPKWAQSFIVIMVLFGGGAILASLVIKIDEVVTVQGQLRPFTGTRDILAPVSATLSQINVKDGQAVKKGELLAIYDTRDATIKAENLARQIELTEKTLKERLALIATDKSSLQRSLEFSKDVAERYKLLSEQGAQSDLSYISQKKQLEDINAQLVKLDQQRAQIKLESTQRLQSLRAEQAQTRLLLENRTIKAPVSGIVFDAKKAAGQVTNMGEQIFKIVPQDAAKAEVFVTNRDIGFVKVGQKANVRVDAYPYTKFGELKGSVSRIGADVLEPTSTNPNYRFPVEIKLLSSTLSTSDIDLPLKPGMAIQANLRLREKPVISLLTDMFSKNLDGLKSLRN